MAKQTYLPLLEKIIEPEKEIIEKEESELIQIGKEKGYLSISRDSGKVKYLACGYEDDYSDPEEKVRAAFYVELIEKYGYPRERINVEVEVPRREPKDRADIVIYEDDVCKQSYGVVECKKEGMPDAEIEQALKQVWGNANNLRAKYGMLVAGNLRIAFDAEKFEHQTRQGIIADLPARYSKPPKFLFRKGDAERDLKPVTQSELDAKFQQCHDILWEGGRRNPAEAFDEMSKLPT
jgi:type I restriction enzyme M protein